MEIVIIQEAPERPVLGALVADEQGAQYRVEALEFRMDNAFIVFGLSACDPQGQSDPTPETWREDMRGWTFVD